MLYHLVTETKENLAVLTSKHFQAFTVKNPHSPDLGYWNGTAEESTTIEIDDLGKDISCQVACLIDTIKTINHQQCVLVRTFACHSELV